MKITRAFAILVPVPEIHLGSGQDICQEQGKVAFGSQDWELFREVDKRRGDEAVEVFIYACARNGYAGEISWHGLYIGHVNSRRGRHPEGNQYRPPSTQNDTSSAIFWEVEELDTLVSPLKIDFLRGLGKKSDYTSNFFPREALLIEYPKRK
jgi:hypothetical protein